MYITPCSIIYRIVECLIAILSCALLLSEPLKKHPWYRSDIDTCERSGAMPGSSIAFWVLPCERSWTLTPERAWALPALFIAPKSIRALSCVHFDCSFWLRTTLQWRYVVHFLMPCTVVAFWVSANTHKLPRADWSQDTPNNILMYLQYLLHWKYDSIYTSRVA